MTSLLGRKPNRLPFLAFLGRLATMDQVPNSQRTHALLATTTVGSAVATVDFTQFIDSRFRAFLFTWHGVLPSTADNLAIRTSADYGSTWDSGAANYLHALQRIQSGGGSSGYSSSATLGYLNSLSTISATASAGGSCGSLVLVNPSDTTQAKHMLVTESHGDGSASIASSSGSIVRNATAVVTGLRFLMASGNNIAAGTFKLYGVN